MQTQSYKPVSLIVSSFSYLCFTFIILKSLRKLWLEGLVSSPIMQWKIREMSMQVPAYPVWLVESCFLTALVMEAASSEI